MEKNNSDYLTEKLDTLFLEALSNKVFSGAAVALSVVGNNTINNKITRCYGHTEGEEQTFHIREETFFDLASLTKPLVTSLTLLSLIDSGQVDFSTNLGELLPAVPKEKKAVTLAQLLSHSSGLPAHRNYFPFLLGLEPTRRKEAVLRSILQEQLQYLPGKGYLYSDLGYMLLGMIIERITGRELPLYWQKTIVAPLGLDREFKFPEKGELDLSCCAATRICPWTHVRLCGMVDDENCRVMGGGAGHAGLFGTLSGVARICRHLCGQWQDLLEHQGLSNALFRRACKEVNSSSFTLGGFDTPSASYSSSGSYFQKPSVGHLGFTGTSFWLDLRRGISVVLLTNRVYMRGDRGLEIKKFRPRVHDLLMAGLDIEP